MGSHPSSALDDNRIIQSLLQALDAFLKLRGPIPLRELVVFLHIALDEGNQAIEYADRLKVRRAEMSKYVHDLGDRARNGGPGLGLIEFKPRGNPHNRQPIFLTKKGRLVAAAILKSLRSPPMPSGHGQVVTGAKSENAPSV